MGLTYCVTCALFPYETYRNKKQHAERIEKNLLSRYTRRAVADGSSKE